MQNAFRLLSRVAAQHRAQFLLFVMETPLSFFQSTVFRAHSSEFSVQSSEYRLITFPT